MADLLKQSSTAQPLVFLMIDSSDHITGKTGLTPTVTLSKSGGAFASPAGTVSEIGSGWYKVAGNATDTNTLGPLILHATSAGADPCDVEYNVVAVDPQSATAFMTSLATVVNLTNAPTAGDFNATMKTSLNAATPASIVGAVGSVTGNVGGNVLGSLAGSVGSVSGNVGGNVSGSVANVLAFANNSITALALATDAVQEIAAGLLDLTDGVETSLTLRQALRLMVAADASKISGAGTTTIVIRNYGDTKNRITATCDTSGNRTAITYDLS